MPIVLTKKLSCFFWFILTCFFPALAIADDREINCIDPQFQQEMNICAFRDFETADKELNTLWPQVMTKVKAFGEGLSAEYQEGPDKLLEAQRLWIKFRDAHCESAAFASVGGSIYPLLYHSCRAEITRERIKQLQEVANEG